MARTMKWPPDPKGGRIDMVEGIDATVTAVVMTLGDLSQNPFNPTDLSMGDITFKTQSTAKSRIQLALRRLEKIIIVDSIEETTDEDGNAVYVISFTDREARVQRSVSING